jgi:predicted translin family RNA/ssDNA-binding protein
MAAFDEEDWSGIAAHLRSSEEQRDALNGKVREMQTLAKQALFALHRGEGSRADDAIARIEALAAEAQEQLGGAPHLRQGFYSSAVQDYTVAVIYRCAGRQALARGWPWAGPGLGRAGRCSSDPAAAPPCCS